MNNGLLFEHVVLTECSIEHCSEMNLMIAMVKLVMLAMCFI